MKIVLLRHATRSLGGPDDTSLSVVGRAQAAQMPRMVSPRGPLPAPSHLYASPKKRARETLMYLSEALGVPVTVDPRLDERHRDETRQEFEARIRSFTDEIGRLASSQSGDECAVVCSHLDWLEAVLVLLPSNLSDREMSHPFQPGDFRIFEVREGVWHLTSSGATTADEGTF